LENSPIPGITVTKSAILNKSIDNVTDKSAAVTENKEKNLRKSKKICVICVLKSDAGTVAEAKTSSKMAKIASKMAKTATVTGNQEKNLRKSKKSVSSACKKITA